MKYNITNCPAFDIVNYECISMETSHLCCWMNEDCILKKLYENIKNCNDYSKILEIEEMDENWNNLRVYDTML